MTIKALEIPEWDFKNTASPLYDCGFWMRKLDGLLHWHFFLIQNSHCIKRSFKPFSRTSWSVVFLSRFEKKSADLVVWGLNCCRILISHPLLTIAMFVLYESSDTNEEHQYWYCMSMCIVTPQGLSFLDLRYHLLLFYLQDLTHLISIKTEGQKITDSEALNRIVTVRTVRWLY